MVGGGDTALEEAHFLTRFANKVTMLVRRDEFRGSKIMQERASNHEKIEILWNTEVTEVHGDATVELAARCATRRAARTSSSPVQGLFIAIGYKPNTDLFADQLRVGRGRLPRGRRRDAGRASRASSWPATSTTIATGRL